MKNSIAFTDLVSHFSDGSKPTADFKVGIEWEKIGVYRETGQAIRYSGKDGVETIFRELIRAYGWQPVREGEHAIALKRGPTSITLEPGGQIELSGWKAATLDENASEIHSHLREIRDVSNPLGIVWLGLGTQPISMASEIEWVPKARYGIMRESLKDGSLTQSMMKETASIQISVDYSDEKDAVRKLRLAMGLSPVLTALFANSPLTAGLRNGFLSRRAHIWRHTAPERTGMVPGVFRSDFSFEAYARYACGIPLLFIVRDGEWIAVQGRTFGQFMDSGWQDHTATAADWELHLSTIFTEARLKKYIEIRGVDCQQTDLGLAVAALVKGIFYDTEAMKKAEGLVLDWSDAERALLAVDGPVRGLRAVVHGQPLLNTAQKIYQHAAEGIQRLAAHGLAQSDEVKYLKPIGSLLAREMTPAEAFLEKLGEPRGNERVRRIIESASI